MGLPRGTSTARRPSLSLCAPRLRRNLILKMVTLGILCYHWLGRRVAALQDQVRVGLVCGQAGGQRAPGGAAGLTLSWVSVLGELRGPGAVPSHGAGLHLHAAGHALRGAGVEVRPQAWPCAASGSPSEGLSILTCGLDSQEGVGGLGGKRPAWLSGLPPPREEHGSKSHSMGKHEQMGPIFRSERKRFRRDLHSPTAEQRRQKGWERERQEGHFQVPSATWAASQLSLPVFPSRTASLITAQT